MRYFCSLTPETLAKGYQKHLTASDIAWECRLDLLDDIPTFLRETHQEWMATYRTNAHGGAGDKKERENIGWKLRLEALDQGASWLDLEWDEKGLAGKVLEARRRGAKVVLSHHEMEDSKDLEALSRMGHELQVDVVKYICVGRSFNDFIRQRQAYGKQGENFVHFYMGDEFKSTRLLSVVYGAPFSFFSPQDTASPAPGQLNEHDLNILRSLQKSAPIKLFAIIGLPVAHSLSPAFHQPKIQAHCAQSLYLNFPMESFQELDACLQTFSDLNGLSITKPMKEHALKWLNQHSATEQLCALPSVNTLYRDHEKFKGANTDMMAIDETLADFEKRQKGRRLRILGCGGLGKAALQVALDRGWQVEITNRNSDRLRSVPSNCIKLEWQNRHQTGCDLLFNATSVGMGDSKLSPLDYIPSGVKAVCDTIYHPRTTRLLQLAKEQGIETFDGPDFFKKQAQHQNRFFLNTLKHS